MYDNTLTGIMEIGYGLHGYNPGMFDVSAVMHMPFQAGAPAEKMSVVFQSLYENQSGDAGESTRNLNRFTYLPVTPTTSSQLINRSKVWMI